MPELPEVEAARCLVHQHLHGKRIVRAHVMVDEKVIEGVGSDALSKALTGRSVARACRKAKHLWIELAPDAGSGDGPALLVHLGMTGSLVARTPLGEVLAAKYERIAAPDPDAEWPPRFCKFDLEMDDGTRLAFTDPRRFGKVRWLPSGAALESSHLAKLAPDALTQLPSLDEWREAMRKLGRRKALRVKALLLDQELLISGVGNWVADEILYRARVHPEQPVAGMPLALVDALHSAVEYVIQHSVSVGSDSDQFPPDWIFHYRWTGKKASSVGGRAIAFITAGARTSAYVPSLQMLVACEQSAGDTGDGKAAARPKKASRAKAVDVVVGGDSVGKQDVAVKTVRAKRTAANGCVTEKETVTVKAVRAKKNDSAANGGMAEEEAVPKKAVRAKKNDSAANAGIAEEEAVQKKAVRAKKTGSAANGGVAEEAMPKKAVRAKKTSSAANGGMAVEEAVPKKAVPAKKAGSAADRDRGAADTEGEGKPKAATATKKAGKGASGASGAAQARERGENIGSKRPRGGRQADGAPAQVDLTQDDPPPKRTAIASAKPSEAAAKRQRGSGQAAAQGGTHSSKLSGAAAKRQRKAAPAAATGATHCSAAL